MVETVRVNAKALVRDATQRGRREMLYVQLLVLNSMVQGRRDEIEEPIRVKDVYGKQTSVWV